MSQNRNSMPLPQEVAKKSSEQPGPKVQFVKEEIKVKATRAGYFGGQRRSAGDEFMLTSSNQLGSWMEVIKD